MTASFSEFEDEPRVDGTETEVALFSLLACSRDVVEHPFGTAAGKIRVDEESALLFHHLGIAVGLQLVADISTTHTLPDDSIGDGFSRCAVPDDNRLTLVGEGEGEG